MLLLIEKHPVNPILLAPNIYQILKTATSLLSDSMGQKHNGRQLKRSKEELLFFQVTSLLD